MLSQVTYVQRYFASNGAVLQINFQPRCHIKEINNFEWIMKIFNMIGMEKTVSSANWRKGEKNSFSTPNPSIPWTLSINLLIHQVWFSYTWLTLLNIDKSHVFNSLIYLTEQMEVYLPSHILEDNDDNFSKNYQWCKKLCYRDLICVGFFISSSSVRIFLMMHSIYNQNNVKCYFWLICKLEA